MRADLLLKKNIDTLLRARGQTRHDLAIWCRRTDAWLSKIFSDKGLEGRKERGIPLKYLDRIADFFGIAVYQLFQPGISHLTERRKMTQRRTGRDRRISARHHDLPTTPRLEIEVSPEDEAMLAELRQLTHDEYERIRNWMHVVRLGRPVSQRIEGPDDEKPGASPPASPASGIRVVRKRSKRS